MNSNRSDLTGLEGQKGGSASASVPPPPAGNPENQEEVNKGPLGLDKMVDFSNKELLRVKTVFPFDVFPTTIVIDIHKITIFSRIFGIGGNLHSFLIDEVSDVFVTNGLFLATLEVIDKNFGANTVKVTHLRRADAFMAKKIIQGLVVAKKVEIDYKEFDTIDNIVNKLIDLGSVPSES